MTVPSMPDYEQLVYWLNNAPYTWRGALLAEAIEACAKGNVFAIGGIETFTKRVIERALAANPPEPEAAPASPHICCWCGKTVHHGADGTLSQASLDKAREHAATCEKHPVKIERDAIAEWLRGFKWATAQPDGTSVIESICSGIKAGEHLK